MGNPSENIKQKKPMTETQKVDWLYYALQDLVVNSLDYNRDRMCKRIVLLNGGIQKLVRERTENAGIFVKKEFEENHRHVVTELQKCVMLMTEAWELSMKMKNADMCEKIREAMNVLGMLVNSGKLYTELED